MPEKNAKNLFRRKSVCCSWCMIAVVCALSLSGCGRAEGSADAAEPAQVKKQLQVSEMWETEDPDNTNLAALLQEKSSGCMVQIQADNRLGSGVIWTAEENRIIVITAAHVIEEAASIRVTFHNGECVGTDAFDQTIQWRTVEDCDLGIIEIPAELVTDPVWEECLAAAVDKEAYDAMTAGDRILVMGSRDGVAGNAYEGTLAESWIYLEDYEQYMMLATTYAQPGMSGGGVFGENGNLIGILSGADEQGMLAIVPLAFILREV